MTPKVSVVVPVYNVETYVARCLDSLQAQTLRELEFLVIDDGSTDDSGKIADGYAAQDGRFHVVHGENRGLSVARNTGIQLSSADYIMFVDSDDWVEPDFCKLPYEAAVKQGADLVFFRYWKHLRNGYWNSSQELTEGLYTSSEAMRMMYHGASVAAWNKMYRRELFEGIRYPEGRVYEDRGTTHLLVYRAKRVWVSDVQLYHYCFRRDSITSLKSEKVIRDRMEMNKREAVWLGENGYSDLCEERMNVIGLSCLIRLGTHDIGSKEYIQALSDRKQSIPNCGWKRKLLLKILRLSPWLFDLVCILCGKRSWQHNA